MTAKAVNGYHDGSSITGTGMNSVQFSSFLADRGASVTMLSVVVPFYDEQGNVAELHHRVHSVLEETGWSYELLFVRTYKKVGDVGCHSRTRA